MKKILFTTLLIFVLGRIYAQVDYNRNSLSIIGLDFNQPHSKEVLSVLPFMAIPDKFFSNPLPSLVYDMGGQKRVVKKNMLEFYRFMDDAILLQILQNQKVGQKILSIWFNRQADGIFNTDVLKDRGMYNANDQEFMVASASKRGLSSLMDSGLKLVNQSYVVIFDYPTIMTKEEHYKKSRIPKDERDSNGWIALASCYIYRLDFNEDAATHFFNNYWITENDENKEEKIKAFDEAEFRFIPVTKYTVAAESIQDNPNILNKKQKTSEELLYILNAKFLKSVIEYLELKSSDKKVKAMISKSKPISAKIGKKEGVQFDRRYNVYENRMKPDSTIKKKRVAVVKAKNVVDNRSVTTGQSDASTFYQIWGDRVDDMGMFIEQRNDAGFNLAFDLAATGMTGINGRMEVYLARLFPHRFVGKKHPGLYTSMKLYAGGGYETGSYGSTRTKKLVKISLGIAKDFYPIRQIHWGPFIGLGVESAYKNINEKAEDEASYIELGARLGYNMRPAIQLIGSYQYNLFLEKGMRICTGEDCWFGKRGGPTAALGIRFMF